MKYITFLLCNLGLFFVATAVSSGEEKPKDRAELAYLDAVKLLAKCILDPNNLVVLAETNYASRSYNFPDASSPQARALRTAFNLRRLMPILSFRGSLDLPDLIWVQVDDFEFLDRRGGTKRSFHPPPRFSQEGVWLCFLKPIETFPKLIASSSGEYSQQINEDATTMKPLELAKKLEVDGWLNEKTWFELATNYSVFRVDAAVRDLPLAKDIDPLVSTQMAASNDRIRSVQGNSAQILPSILLSKEQLAEIKELVQMFSSPGSAPSIDELIKLKSEFADAVIRALSERSGEMEISTQVLQ